MAATTTASDRLTTALAIVDSLLGASNPRSKEKDDEMIEQCRALQKLLPEEAKETLPLLQLALTGRDTKTKAAAAGKLKTMLEQLRYRLAYGFVAPVVPRRTESTSPTAANALAVIQSIYAAAGSEEPLQRTNERLVELARTLQKMLPLDAKELVALMQLSLEGTDLPTMQYASKRLKELLKSLRGRLSLDQLVPSVEESKLTPLMREWGVEMAPTDCAPTLPAPTRTVEIYKVVNDILTKVVTFSEAELVVFSAKWMRYAKLIETRYFGDAMKDKTFPSLVDEKAPYKEVCADAAFVLTCAQNRVKAQLHGPLEWIRATDRLDYAYALPADATRAQREAYATAVGEETKTVRVMMRTYPMENFTGPTAVEGIAIRAMVYGFWERMHRNAIAETTGAGSSIGLEIKGAKADASLYLVDLIFEQLSKPKGVVRDQYLTALSHAIQLTLSGPLDEITTLIGVVVTSASRDDVQAAKISLGRILAFTQDWQLRVRDAHRTSGVKASWAKRSLQRAMLHPKGVKVYMQDIMGQVTIDDALHKFYWILDSYLKVNDRTPEECLVDEIVLTIISGIEHMEAKNGTFEQGLIKQFIADGTVHSLMYPLSILRWQAELKVGLSQMIVWPLMNLRAEDDKKRIETNGVAILKAFDAIPIRRDDTVRLRALILLTRGQLIEWAKASVKATNEAIATRDDSKRFAVASGRTPVFLTDEPTETKEEKKEKPPPAAAAAAAVPVPLPFHDPHRPDSPDPLYVGGGDDDIPVLRLPPPAMPLDGSTRLFLQSSVFQ